MQLLAPVPFARRHFLHGASAGLAAPLVAASEAHAQAAAPPARATGRPMLKLEAPMPAGSGQEVGFAVLGLGKFALDQILPSFGEAKQARLTALVRGRERAGRLRPRPASTFRARSRWRPARPPASA